MPRASDNLNQSDLQRKMMETMSINSEQFYKPYKSEEKPRLKLDLNLGEDRWNTMLSSPDLKKLQLPTPELDRMVANAGQFGYGGSQAVQPPPYQGHRDEHSVQGPSMSHPAPNAAMESEDTVTASFIEALRKIHEENDFKSEVFSLPPNTQRSLPNYTDQYSKPQQSECSQAWNNFAAPSVSYAYNPIIQSSSNYQMANQQAYIHQDQIPQYDMGDVKPSNLMENLIPDPSQIDKLNLTTAEKLNIYSQIPIHEVADPELQERLKSERKKMRNRIAASKCRKRKLQKEAELEDKVKILKKKNGDLSSTVMDLRREVMLLKEKIMKHANSGCNIKPFAGMIDPRVPEKTLNSVAGMQDMMEASQQHQQQQQNVTVSVTDSLNLV